MKPLIAIVLASILSSSTFAEVEADTDPIIIKADIPCYDTETVINTLKKQYKEVPIIYGMASDQAGSTMSVWTSPSSKSWTILATKGDVSCIIGTGVELKLIPLKVGKRI